MIIELHETEWVFSPSQRRQGLDVIIENVLVSPVQPKRWYPMKDRFLEALFDRAETLNAPLPHVVKAVADANLRQVSYTDLPRIAPDGALDAWGYELRKQVNELVTVDLLGPAWRPRLTTLRRRPVNRAELHALLKIDLLRLQGNLGANERTLLSAYIASDGKLNEVASRLGWRYDLTRQRWSRLCKKLCAS
jgi:hypothetical protein